MKTIKFTVAEVVEVLRALELAICADNDARVNIDPAAVAAKASALSKVEQASGMRGPEARLKELMKNATSVRVDKL